MRLILSRKGFDSKYGGFPSPILEDGTLLSVPIPDKNGRRLDELRPRGVNLAEIVADLTRGKVRAAQTVHLDPDLDYTSVPRERAWVPAFGQASNAGRHLDREGVDLEDVFLFFGWFREVEKRAGKWHYVPKAPNLHVLFGWLRVGRKILEGECAVPEAIKDHPHFDPVDRPYNRVYVAQSLHDGGIFPKFLPVLQLTDSNVSRSIWRLPSWFHPDRHPALTYHRNPKRWELGNGNDSTQLRSVARGQEFVLDTSYYPEAEQWIKDLLTRAA